MLRKSIKIELKPTKEQERFLEKCFDYSRYIYNKALEEWLKQYEDYTNNLVEKPPNRWSINQYIRSQKEEWEKVFPTMILDSAIEDLNLAFNMFWRNNGHQKPKFKSRRNERNRSFRIYRKNKYSIQLKGNFIKLQGINFLIKTKEIPKTNFLEIKEATIKRKAHKYYAILSATFDLKSNKDFIWKNGPNSIVGIDLGVKTFAVMNGNDGNVTIIKNINDRLIKINNRISIYSKILSRKDRDSKNYEKTLVKLRKSYLRYTEVKKDFLNKLSTNILKKYRYVVIEDLKVSELLSKNKNTNLSKSISDSNWREFRSMLEKKSLIYGNTIIVADKSFPSTQKCSNCGHLKEGNEKITLKDRNYNCSKCSMNMNRDINASINLKLYGMYFVGKAKDLKIELPNVITHQKILEVENSNRNNNDRIYGSSSTQDSKL